MKTRFASFLNPQKQIANSARRTATLRWLLAALVVSLTASSAEAKELYLEFIQGLRAHRHYDFALSYLDELEQNTAVPADVRIVLPYERGMTLLEQSRQTFDPDLQNDYLNRAAAALEQFVAGAGDHPLAGQANTDRAIILLERAKLEVWKSEDPANEGNEESFRQAARDLIGQAKGVFESAQVQHQAAFEAFDIFIPEVEVELRAQRDAAEQRMLHGKLYLAQCTYWLAHTYPADSPEYRDTLTLSSVEFEAIHEAHRSQMAGLYARIWQGKCFEEQDELGAAIGIYDPFIENPGRSPVVLGLRSTALHFKLICLNRRQDYATTEILASDWMRAEETRLLRRDPIGLGITYERALALEGLAMAEEETSPKRTDYLNQALGLARSLNIYAGQYKVPSTRLIQRLMLALNRDPTDPESFEAAFGIGSQMLDEVVAIANDINRIQQSSDHSELTSKLESLRAAAQEMSRMFELAINLARPTTDPRELLVAHLRLAYGYVNQQKYYEAAALAEYLMEKRAADYPELAVDCGFINLLAHDNAYTFAPASDRDFERERLMATATRLEELFPDSSRANDARNTIGKVLFDEREYIEAAAWFNKVPPTASDYGISQIKAGQSFWSAYMSAELLPESERPAEMQTWIDQAETHLEAGVAASEAQLAPDAVLNDIVARGKLSLAGIRMLKGIFTTQGETIGAVELLSADPFSVVAATRMPEGLPRPRDNSIQSINTAAHALQQLLRAQIGAASQSEGDARQGYLDASANTRAMLEQLAAEGGDQSGLTQLYVRFGEELQKELTRIQESGDVERLRSVRDSFESFLNDVADRREGQNLSSLLWIAETFAALGENATDDPAKAEAYFSRAAGTLETMLSRALNEPDFVESEEQILPIRLTLARTLRRAGEFSKAEAELNEVLGAYSGVVAVQEEAALLYQLWAESGAVDKYGLAINGRQSPPPIIWGWGLVAQMMQGSIRPNQPDVEAVASFLNARVHQVDCMIGHAKSADADEHDRILEKAKKILHGLVLTVDDTLLATRMSDFERQYADILAELEEPQALLADFSGEMPDEEGENGETMAAVDPIKGAESEESEGGGTNWVLIAILIIVGFGSVGGLCYMSIRQNQKRRQARSAKIAAASQASRSRVQSR
jgi:hypothetical protein